jgi:hypothetical protein
MNVDTAEKERSKRTTWDGRRTIQLQASWFPHLDTLLLNGRPSELGWAAMTPWASCLITLHALLLPTRSGSWQVQRPLHLGGLGMMDTRKMGLALRLRWVWLHRTDSSCLWSSMPFKEDATTMAFFWASTQCIMGDGTSMSDPWLDEKMKRYQVFKNDKNRSVNRWN